MAERIRQLWQGEEPGTGGVPEEALRPSCGILLWKEKGSVKCTEPSRERPEDCGFSRGHRRPFGVLRGAWEQDRAKTLLGKKRALVCPQ